MEDRLTIVQTKCLANNCHPQIFCKYSQPEMKDTKNNMFPLITVGHHLLYHTQVTLSTQELCMHILTVH